MATPSWCARSRRKLSARLSGVAAAAAVVCVVLLCPRVGRAEPAALLVDAATGFVPFANDVPVMLGAGVRLAEIHEIWARVGYMPVGDDRQHAFGVGGYRLVLSPRRLFRPVLGGLFAGLPATCGHDARDLPTCAPPPLFIFAALGGVRLEPTPWLGLSVLVEVGTDTHPNPFGMVEAGLTFALPL